MNYPNHWDSMTFGEISEDIDKSGPMPDEEFDYVEISSIDRDHKRVEDVNRITAEEASSRAKQHLQSGDLLIAKVRPKLNGVALVPDRYDGAIGTTGFYVVRSKAVDRKYLYYFVQTQEFVNSMDRKATGSSYPAVRIGDIDEFEVPIAPIEEQDRIVAKFEALFSKLDSGLSELQNAQNSLDSFRKTLISEAVRGTFSEEWRTQYSGELNTVEMELEPVEDDGDRPEIPANWKWVKFESILSEPLRNGHSAREAESGIRTLTLDAVTENDFSQKYTKITEANPEKVEDLWLESGDILIERSSGTTKNVGLSAVYNGEDDYAIFPDLMIRARVKQQTVSPEFANYMLQTPYIRNYLITKSKGSSGMSKINQGHLRELPFPLAPKPEQDIILSELDQMTSIIDGVNQAIVHQRKRAENLRQSILEAGFEGKLVQSNTAEDLSKTAQGETKSESSNDKSGEQRTLTEVTSDVE